MAKKKAIYQGFCAHDDEVIYKCPACKELFGSWTIFHQKKNENGTKNYCPFCKEELSGLE